MKPLKQFLLISIFFIPFYSALAGAQGPQIGEMLLFDSGVPVNQLEVPVTEPVFFEFTITSVDPLMQVSVKLVDSANTGTTLYELFIPSFDPFPPVVVDGSVLQVGLDFSDAEGWWTYIIGVWLNLETMPIPGGPVAPGIYRIGIDAFDILGFISNPNPSISNFVITVTNGDDPDTDSDGVPDSTDNCPDASNADQADNDGDGDGDACDMDDDNDGVLDGVDNCQFEYNPDQTDDNADDFGDACVPVSSNIDPSADVDPSASIGEDVEVDKGVEVGPNSIIGDGAMLDKDSSVGENVEIGPDVQVSQGVIIHNNVTVMEGAVLDRGVVLCDGSTVGAYASIGRDSEVGHNGEVADFEMLRKESFVEGDGSCTQPAPP